MGKGSNTTTTSQQQSYQPAGAGYITNALNTAQNAAATPFQTPVAPVAGFSQDQQNAFNTVNNAQGMAQPYINQAQQYFSPQGTQAFLNPYASNVMAGLQDVFGQQASQQQGQLTQAAGGVGADRIAVGQSELAKQQGLAAGQTLSGLYNNAAQQAQSAGYGTAALGSQAQNAALQGAQAQLGTGGLQQQLSQAQQNAPYQNILAQLAYPFQTSQFLSGATGALAPGLGGTTSGTGSTTGPAPSMLSQILGLGTAGLGAAGGAGAFGGKGSYGGGSPFTGDAYGGSSANPLPGLSASDYGAGYAEGGATESSPFDLPPNFNDKPINVAEHSIIPTVQTPAIRPEVPHLNLNPPAPQQQSGSGLGQVLSAGIKLAGMFDRGGRINPYAEGGAVSGETEQSASPYQIRTNGGQHQVVNIQTGQVHYTGTASGASNAQATLNSRRYASGGIAGFADGGDPGDDPSPASFDERFPYRMATPEGVDAWRNDTSASPAMAYAGDDKGDKAFPPPSGAHGRSVGVPAIEQPADAPQDVSARSRTPAAPAESTPASKRDRFIDSPWAALMAAGLGIAGGTSPFAAVNIGQGGMQGLKTLQEQRASGQKDETIEQATRRLDLEAKHHEDQYSRMTPYQKGHLDLAQTAATREEMKPVKVGVDLLGRDVMARRDPKSGQYINTMTGKPVDADSNTLQVPPQYRPPAGGAEAEADPAALPPHARVTQGFNAPEGVRPEILAQLPPQRAATIRAIDEGRQSLTSVPLRDRQAVSDALNAYDPNFDQSVWTMRNQQQRDMSTNGNAGKMILAVNQLLPHLKKASDTAAKLDNSDYPAANTLANWYATATGDPRVKNFETVREVAAMDAARLLRGSGQMAEQDIDFWRKNLASAGSPAQLQTIIQTLADDLMGARISSIQHSYRTNMRMEPPDFISKEAKEALGAIKGRQPGAAQPPAAAAPTPAAAAAPPAVAAPAAPPTAKPPTVTQNGHTYVLQPDGSYK